MYSEGSFDGMASDSYKKYPDTLPDPLPIDFDYDFTDFVTSGSFGSDANSSQTLLGHTAAPIQERNQHTGCSISISEMHYGASASESSSLLSKDSPSRIEFSLPYYPELLPQHLLGQIHSALSKNPTWCNQENLPFSVVSPAQHSETTEVWGKEGSNHTVTNHLSGLIMRGKWIFVRWIEVSDKIAKERRSYIIRHRHSPGGWSTWSIWYFDMDVEGIELDKFGFEKQASIYKNVNQSNDATRDGEDASHGDGNLKSLRLKRPKGQHHPESPPSSRRRPNSGSTTSPSTTEGQDIDTINVEMTSITVSEPASTKEKEKKLESQNLERLNGTAVTESRQPSNASQCMREERGPGGNVSCSTHPETIASGHLPRAHADMALPQVKEHSGPLLDFEIASVTTPATQMMTVVPTTQGGETETRVELDSAESSVRTRQNIMFSLKMWNQSPSNRRPRSAESCSTTERLRTHAEAGGVFTKTEVNAREKTLWLELKNGTDDSFPWCFKWRADENAEEEAKREVEFQDLLEYCRPLIIANPSRVCVFEVSREIAS